MKKKPFTIAEALNSESTSQKTYGKADKKSSGRKSIDKELRREHLVTCRLNQKEYEILKQLIEIELSSDASAYIRRLILKEARALNIN
ncbi:hypothetical protein [Helicobacter apodemus]|uniref:Uncharacterized protein n=1 Tax=Helicobacter apodemus TaxID=135569 RepID=A0A2U8FG90_9HELI|nr:hypothetical protein [Helicobacter apodemus]AWI35148.1 hypothetical protein CDV25_09945 [Helicobacter apodemus]